MTRIRFVLASLALSVAPITAHAEILVGGYGSTNSTALVRGFADTANGNVAPLGTLGGPTSTLVGGVAIVHEPIEGVLYVADFWGQAIRVYPESASGDAAPLRVLSPPILGQVRTLAVDTAHGELLTISSGCCPAAFELTASGTSAARLRSLSWGGGSGSVTELNYPYAMAYLAATDEIALIDTDPAAPYAPKLLVFNRTDSGNTAPKRVVRGAQTRFGSWLGGLAHDAARGELVIATIAPAPDSGNAVRILFFDDQATGDAAPLREISGSATQLALEANTAPSGINLTPDGRLVVAISDNQGGAGSRLVVFDATASGNATPLQVILGPQTGLVGSIGAPSWRPGDVILRHGFE